MPTHTKPPKQPTVADVPSLSSWRSGIPKNWGKTPSMFVPANLWNAPPEQKYVTKNFLSEIFSHGILYITLHHFPCMPRHALKNVGCLVVFLEASQPHKPEQSNSQVCFAIWALHQYEHSYWNHGAPQLNSESWSFRWCTVYFPKDPWDWLIYLSTFIVNINQM